MPTRPAHFSAPIFLPAPFPVFFRAPQIEAEIAVTNVVATRVIAADAAHFQQVRVFAAEVRTTVPGFQTPGQGCGQSQRECVLGCFHRDGHGALQETKQRRHAILGDRVPAQKEERLSLGNPPCVCGLHPRHFCRLRVVEGQRQARCSPARKGTHAVRTRGSGGAFDSSAAQLSLKPRSEALIPELAESHPLRRPGVLHESQMLRIASVGPATANGRCTAGEQVSGMALATGSGASGRAATPTASALPLATVNQSSGRPSGHRQPRR